ncbi:hypothetical protein BC831DRAFT_97556 [Entophlyctis helioformis]|nr:hypothetical protein BC831DRAFT_97556 [Entophlyctis helioformis]
MLEQPGADPQSYSTETCSLTRSPAFSKNTFQFHVLDASSAATTAPPQAPQQPSEPDEQQSTRKKNKSRSAAPADHNGTASDIHSDTQLVFSVWLASSHGKPLSTPVLLGSVPVSLSPIWSKLKSASSPVGYEIDVPAAETRPKTGLSSLFGSKHDAANVATLTFTLGVKPDPPQTLPALPHAAAHRQQDRSGGDRNATVTFAASPDLQPGETRSSGAAKPPPTSAATNAAASSSPAKASVAWDRSDMNASTSTSASASNANANAVTLPSMSMSRPATTPPGSKHRTQPQSQPQPDVASWTTAQRDIEQRQQLIDRLLGELDSRTEAIRKVGQDLVHLRQVNEEQEAEIARLRARLDQSEMCTKRLMNTADVDMLSLGELQRRYVSLVDRLQGALDLNKQMSGELEDYRVQAFEKGDMERRYNEIRHAHTAQQAYVLKLQETLQAKVGQFPKTVRKQEQVIAKMEGLLRVALAATDAGDVDQLLEATKREPLTGDQRMCELMVRENRALKGRLALFETGTGASADSGTTDARVRQLEKQLEDAQQRYAFLLIDDCTAQMSDIG